MCWQVEAAKAKEAARLLHAEAQRLTQQATMLEAPPRPSGASTPPTPPQLASSSRGAARSPAF